MPILKVKTLDGRVFEVEVQGDTSVAALKEMVAAKAGMTVDACRVIFCGKSFFYK
ncbi:hypothetical protein T484DRAFT_1838999 [Baffinella frigidus]|nr:hypothetical protein T484DRAFT_1838999 [Cryptophyta sp. CCMP2293]